MVETTGTAASLSPVPRSFAVFEFLLPILVFLVPVLAVVALALFFVLRLRGSCGGVGQDGRCVRCGKPAAEIPKLEDRGRSSTCP